MDVFAFLVKDDEPNGSKPEAKRFPHLEKTPSVTNDSDDESIVRSMHSDSGISMGDSGVLFGIDSLVDTRLPPLLEDGLERTGTGTPKRDEPSHTRRVQWKWPDVPRATHKHHTLSDKEGTPSPEQVHIDIPPTGDGFDRGYCSSLSSPSGYDLVADRLASEELPPVFRSFRKIKFRLLLQLQDEIIEMEQQLATSEKTDTQSRLNSDGSTSAASRRLGWQWGQSDLPAHRLHILGRLSVKLEQYWRSNSSVLDNTLLTVDRSSPLSVSESTQVIVITYTGRC